MLKKKMWMMGVMGVLLITVASPTWASGGRDFRGMEVVIGNWWENYNVDTWRPRSDYEERELEYRKQIQRDYNVKISQRNIAGWGNMQQVTANSIMSGRPAASVFFLEPRWAMALHSQGLLYPVSDIRSIDFRSTSQVEWNQTTTRAFTFNGKAYGFSIGYGTSRHAQVLYFNKRLFREAGLDPNLPYEMQKAGTWTWANFIDICKRLTRDINNDGIMDTYAMTADLSTEILDAIVASNGANYIERDSVGRFVNATNRPEFLEALQYAIRLKNEGVLMPRPDPETSSWDWYQTMFPNGRVAMLVEPQYFVDRLANMRDDWGMVLFPKGPKARDYVVYTDENILVVPALFKPDEAERIVSAVALWYKPVDDDWRAPLYRQYRDTRAVDETFAMIRNPRYSVWKNHLFIPGLERGHIAWEMWWHEGDPAQLIEAVSQEWNALINDANRIR
jgi:ABC-type glycerol-3-phosphate transport system substrate-binding protein